MGHGHRFTQDVQRQVFVVDTLEIGGELGGVRFEGGDHVLVGRGDQRLAQRTFTLLYDRRGAAGSLGQSLEGAERRGQHLFAATGHFGGRAGGLRVKGHELEA